VVESQGGKAVSINQYPEWIKCNELNAFQSQEIIALKERIKRLEEALEAVAKVIGPIGKSTWVSDDELNQAWELYMKTKEAKP
jgi:CRISPR/Cas system CMR-associated protein Cmr1 (group 7 of RAMP superfamily)